MGGDNAPGEIVKGAVDAVTERKDITVCLTGQKDVIEKELSKYTYKIEQIEIVDAPEVIETGEPPVNAIRKKKNSSLVVGLNLVKTGKRTALYLPEAPELFSLADRSSSDVSKVWNARR